MSRFLTIREHYKNVRYGEIFRLQTQFKKLTEAEPETLRVVRELIIGSSKPITRFTPTSIPKRKPSPEARRLRFIIIAATSLTALFCVLTIICIVRKFRVFFTFLP